MKKVYPFLLLLTLSCKKQSHSGDDHEIVADYGYAMRSGQMNLIYDATAFSGDSLAYLNPPAGTLYKWTSTPSGTVQFSGDYQHGKASIGFTAPGNYMITADIYDSLGDHLLAHTNKLRFEVASDTLVQYQSINPEDTLVLIPTMVSQKRGDTAVAQLWFQTAKTYLTTAIDISAVAVGPDMTGYHLFFSDSSRLPGFPFGAEPGNRPILQNISLGFTAIGVPVPLIITWLDKTYTGTITINKDSTVSYSLDNPGAVRIGH